MKYYKWNWCKFALLLAIFYTPGFASADIKTLELRRNVPTEVTIDKDSLKFFKFKYFFLSAPEEITVSGPKGPLEISKFYGWNDISTITLQADKDSNGTLGNVVFIKSYSNDFLSSLVHSKTLSFPVVVLQDAPQFQSEGTHELFYDTNNADPDSDFLQISLYFEKHLDLRVNDKDGDSIYITLKSLELDDNYRMEYRSTGVSVPVGPSLTVEELNNIEIVTREVDENPAKVNESKIGEAVFEAKDDFGGTTTLEVNLIRIGIPPKSNSLSSEVLSLSSLSSEELKNYSDSGWIYKEYEWPYNNIIFQISDDDPDLEEKNMLVRLRRLYKQKFYGNGFESEITFIIVLADIANAYFLKGILIVTEDPISHGDQTECHNVMHDYTVNHYTDFIKEIELLNYLTRPRPEIVSKFGVSPLEKSDQRCTGFYFTNFTYNHAKIDH